MAHLGCQPIGFICNYIGFICNYPYTTTLALVASAVPLHGAALKSRRMPFPDSPVAVDALRSSEAIGPQQASTASACTTGCESTRGEMAPRSTALVGAQLAARQLNCESVFRGVLSYGRGRNNALSASVAPRGSAQPGWPATGSSTRRISAPGALIAA